MNIELENLNYVNYMYTATYSKETIKVRKVKNVGNFR